MPSDLFDKELVFHCSEQVIKALPPEAEKSQTLMKIGLVLYRQGNVFNVKQDGMVVSAVVQDVKRAYVKLDLDYFPLSSCSCSSGFPCRHLVAAFLYVYAMTGYLGDFLNEWKGGAKPSLATLQRHGVVKKGVPNMEQSVKEWVQFFEDEIDQLDKVQGMGKIYALWYQLYPKLKASAPAQEELKPLYRILLAERLLIELCRFYHKPNIDPSYFFHYVEPFVGELQQSLFQNIQTIQKQPLPFFVDPLLSEMRDYTRRLLFCGKGLLYPRIITYRLIWESILNRKKWIAEEKGLLAKRKKEELDRDGQFALECDLALVHFDFLEKNDERIINFFQNTDLPLLPFMFQWLTTITSRKEFQRFRKWVPAVLEQAKHYIQDQDFTDKQEVILYVLNEFEQYRMATGDHDTFEEACRKLLPYSYVAYHEYLLDEERYDQWAELQLLIGFSLDDVDRGLLKHIEKTAPNALLPILHQEIDAKIAEKKRKSYRYAVKHLKRLKRLYKKLSAADTWDHYFQTLTDRHKRLRAFQEELVKGKLL